MPGRYPGARRARRYRRQPRADGGGAGMSTIARGRHVRDPRHPLLVLLLRGGRDRPGRRPARRGHRRRGARAPAQRQHHRGRHHRPARHRPPRGAGGELRLPDHPAHRLGHPRGARGQQRGRPGHRPAGRHDDRPAPVRGAGPGAAGEHPARLHGRGPGLLPRGRQRRPGGLQAVQLRLHGRRCGVRAAHGRADDRDPRRPLRRRELRRLPVHRRRPRRGRGLLARAAARTGTRASTSRPAPPA